MIRQLSKLLAGVKRAARGPLGRLRAGFDAFGVRASVRDEDSGWASITRSGGGPADRSWAELSREFIDVLEAWRLNPWVRQVVRLMTAYVVGDGLKLASSRPEVQAFIEEFWQHPENRLDERLAAWNDELSRVGELFPILFTNKISGMSQVRIMPASCIETVETEPQDYEKETGYLEAAPGTIERKRWKSGRTARVYGPRGDNRKRRPEPMMLHYTINKVVGATRGESDLLPLLPWARRYTGWLKERVKFNSIRNKMALMWVQLSDGTQVEKKRRQYQSEPPGEGGILVTGPDEKIGFPDATIRGFEAEPDGKALRLAMATASNQSLVHFGEGDTANLSTSVSMDDRTFRSYRQRREEFGGMLADLAGRAYQRKEAVLGQEITPLARLGIRVEYSDISRSDNKELADAARSIVSGLAEMKEAFGLGSRFDEVAVRLAFKFAGELLPEDEIRGILAEGGGKGRQAEEQGGEQAHRLNGHDEWPRRASEWRRRIRSEE